jgi:hypothetical protein
VAECDRRIGRIGRAGPGSARYAWSVLVPIVAALAFGSDQPAGVVFVNFDGVVLEAGPVDDATRDITQIAELAGAYAPYGDGDEREAVLQATRANFAAYDIVVTATRPDSGDYVMSVTSPTNPLGHANGLLLGIAPLDCGDAQTGSNVTFAFHGIDDEHTAGATATTVTQEVAHSFGLEHVDDPRDIMYAYNVGGTPRFVDECLPVTPDASGTIHCEDEHAEQCGEGDLQNAHAELLALFGPSSPDTEPPVDADSGQALPVGYGPAYAPESGCRVHASDGPSAWSVATIGLVLVRIRTRR